jgi:hypothetical protein
MKERRLLIDDTRTEEELYAMGLPCRVDLIARNYWEGYKQLWQNGPWDVLYIDHDLQSYDKNGLEFTGYDIMCDIECEGELVGYNYESIPKKIICVSSNPSGRKRIEQVIDNIERKRNGK